MLRINADKNLSLFRSCQKDWLTNTTCSCYNADIFIFCKIRWRGSLLSDFCTFFTIWGVSWQTAKMRAHFIAQSERGKNSSQTRSFFVVWDSYLAASQSKVILYKSCCELSLLVQCTTCTVEPAQSFNLKRCLFIKQNYEFYNMNFAFNLN